MRGRKASGTACKRCATCHTFAECRTCRSRRSRGLVRFSYGPAIFLFAFRVSGFGLRVSGFEFRLSAETACMAPCPPAEQAACAEPCPPGAAPAAYQAHSLAAVERTWHKEDSHGLVLNPFLAKVVKHLQVLPSSLGRGTNLS